MCRSARARVGALSSGTIDSYDTVVIGAGFGGLGAALALAEAGRKPLLLDALKYPGGCASTFERSGDRFESGATLFSGFDEGQLFHRLIAKHSIDVVTEPIDPLVELRTSAFSLPVPRDRARFIDNLCAFPNAPVHALRQFFALQHEVSNALWPLFDDPSLLPPFDLRAIASHLRRVGNYLPLLSLVGTPLVRVLERFSLNDFAPLRVFIDAVCQITVQTSAAEAEAPLALAALDYFFRGTRHVRGGIGELAWGMARAAQRSGAEISFADRALSINPGDVRRYRVRTRRRVVETDHIVANVIPSALIALTTALPPARSLERLSARVEMGWGAAMQYRVVDREMRPASAHHLELVADVTQPFIEGNHVFCSISGADEQRTLDGLRTVTLSTHVPLAPDVVRARDDASYFASVQQRMNETLALRAPEVVAATRRTLTASPRTFERFTSRPRGLVGGIPRTAGLWSYATLSPREPWPGIWLAGDSVFPGQSTLATTVCGMRVSAAITG